MKNLFLISLLSLLFCACKPQQSQQVSTVLPNNTHQEIVIDLSAILSAKEKTALSDDLIKFNKKTQHQIAILTIDSITPYTDPLKFAMDVANHWGVGDKKENDGVLIMIAPKERKTAIAVGTGVETILTAELCNIIIQRDMIPEFRNQNYHTALQKALQTIMKTWHPELYQ